MKLNSNGIFATLGRSMLLATAIATPVLADYQSTVLSQGPVGYYRLSETATPPGLITTTPNSGSLGVAGTYFGTANFFRGFPGAIADGGTSVHFDGSSQAISNSFVGGGVLNPTNFSVEAWLYADGVSANCALSCGHFANPRSGWLIYQTAGTGYELRIYNGINTAAAANPVGNATNIVQKWTHVVATFDGSLAKIYLNGQLSATKQVSVPFAPNADGGFTMGQRADTGFKWAGKQDEVAFYTNALDAGTISNHYVAGISAPSTYASLVTASNPLLYYHLNDAGDPVTTNLGTLGAAGNGDISSGVTTAFAGPNSLLNYRLF